MSLCEVKMASEHGKENLTDLGFKLAHEMPDDGFKYCKNYCSINEVIGAKRLEEISTFMELFAELVSRDEVSPKDISFLKKMLSAATPGKFQPLLKNYEEGISTAPTQCDENEDSLPLDLVKAFDYLGENLGRDWRRVLRRLGLKESQFDKITAKHPFDLESQIRCGLELWASKRKDSDLFQLVVNALRECQLNLYANELEKSRSF